MARYTASRALYSPRTSYLQPSSLPTRLSQRPVPSPTTRTLTPPIPQRVPYAIRQMSTSKTTPSTSTPKSNPSQPTTSPNHPLRHRLVVSSFLSVGTPHTPAFRLALFKRSSLVRSYPHKWAACSGSVDASDPNPQAAALREIREETGIREEELELLAEGTRLEIVDEELATRWEICPFVWGWKEGRDGGEEGARKLGERIVLDWEHTEVRVVRVEEVGELDTVEDLGRSVEAALGMVGRGRDRC